MQNARQEFKKNWLVSNLFHQKVNSVDFGRVGVYSLEKICIGVGGGVYMFRK